MKGKNKNNFHNANKTELKILCNTRGSYLYGRVKAKDITLA